MASSRSVATSAWWVVGMLAVGCSDLLGLDDMAVGAAESSTGGGDACSACSESSCIDACTGSTDVAGCYAFLQCVQTQGCADQACATECLAANPAGQAAVECICTECATDCADFCVGAGTGGAGGSAGAGGNSAGAGGS